MDGVGEDFSGLPERKSRRERREPRAEPDRRGRRADSRPNHRKRLMVVATFVLALILLAVSLVAVFAPTPYLGTSHGALANSVGGAGAEDCRPAGGPWICTTESAGETVRYEVSVDWAGCWSGTLVGPRAARGEARPTISGCVSILDHITAD